MKTVSDIAKQIGVSKSAVHKRLRVEPLKGLLQNNIFTVGNKILLDEYAENILKSTFSGKTTTNIEEIGENDNVVVDLVDDFHEKTSTVDDLTVNFIKSLQSQIANLITQNEDLRHQLNEERLHNREQSNKIISLAEQGQKIAENAQTLQAIENVKPRLTEEKKRGLFNIFSRRKNI